MPPNTDSYEYEADDNFYCYRGTNVLRNKLHLKDLEQLHFFEKQLTTERLTKLSDCPILGELFREGNGRTQREFFRRVALNAGHILDWQKIAPDDLLAADVCAFNQNYTPLFGLLQTALRVQQTCLPYYDRTKTAVYCNHQDKKAPPARP